MTASKICPQCFLYSETNSSSNVSVIPGGNSTLGTASLGKPGISLVQLPKYCSICEVLRLELTSRSCSGWLAAADEDDGVVELGEAARPFEVDGVPDEAVAATAAAAAAAATAAAVEFTLSVLFACGPDRVGSGRFFMTGCCGGMNR